MNERERPTATIEYVLFLACKEGRHHQCAGEYRDNGDPKFPTVIYYCTCKHHIACRSSANSSNP